MTSQVDGTYHTTGETGRMLLLLQAAAVHL